MRLLIATIISLLVIPVMAAQWQGPDDVLEAAAKGNPEAQLEMGILFQFGFHMPGNKVPALAWYLAAAKQGNQSAAQKSAALEKDMLPTEVEEARQLSQDVAALAAISSSTTSNPSHIPDIQEQATEPATTEEPVASQPEQALENNTGEQNTNQGEVTQETMPEPLPEIGPESGTEKTPKPDGPIQPEAAQ